jgi:hypothetical protein
MDDLAAFAEVRLNSTTFSTKGKLVGERSYLVLGDLHLVNVDSIFVDRRDRNEYKSGRDVDHVSIVLRPRPVAPMSTRRITLLCFAAVLGVWVLLFVVPSLRYRSNITRDHFDLIETGMTMSEVRNLLGGPPGRYTDRPTVIVRKGVLPSDRRESDWIGDEGIIFITWTIEPTDPVWRVAKKHFKVERPLSFAERCRRVFPWW